MFDTPKRWITTLLQAKTVPLALTPSPTTLKPHLVQRQIAFYWQQFLKDQPIAFVDIVQRARYYATNSSFLKMFCPLRTSVYNYGFRLRAQKKGDQAALDKWLAEEAQAPLKSMTDAATGEEVEIETNTTRGEQITKFVIDAWNEWLLIDNVVALWLKDRHQPVLLDPYRCLYSDVLGVELLKYSHGLNNLQIAQLPTEQQERFRKFHSVFINPKFGEHYRVLKRSHVGDGFAIPGILSVFKLFGQIESMEAGFHQMGWVMRKVTRHHKLGHEIKSGPHAGKSTYFWNKKRDQQVHQGWSDVVGIDDYRSNFDHEITFPWPDMKFFDETCWKGTDNRLRNWAGPIGLMLFAKGVTPFLTNLLRSQVTHERKQTMGPFLQTVIQRSFTPPVDFRIVWGTQIFTEDRLYAEMMKFATLQGNVSPQTLTEHVGLESDEEQQLKMDAVGDPDAKKKFTPIWDPSHGMAPALDGTQKPEPPKPAGASGAASDARPGSPPGQPHNS